MRSSLDPPWELRIEDEAPLTLVAVVSGETLIWFDGDEPLRLDCGDVAIVRRPEPYTVADDAATAPQAVLLPRPALHDPRGPRGRADDDFGVRTWGNSSDGVMVLLTGTYQLDGEVSRRLLRALPAMIVVREGDWDAGSSRWRRARSSRTTPVRRPSWIAS